MTGKGQKINMFWVMVGFHIHRHMGYRLGTVHQDKSPVFMSQSCQVMNIIEVPGYIGSAANRQQAGMGIISF